MSEGLDNRGPAPRRFWAVWRWKLHWQILLGLVLGAAVGLWLGAQAVAAARGAEAAEGVAQLARHSLTSAWPWMLLDLLGELFLNGLKLVVVPLVTSSIVLAVIQLGSGKGFGRLGLKTLGYYLLSSSLAIVLGLSLVNAFEPGRDADGRGILVGRELSAFADAQAEVAQRTVDKDASSFLEVFRQMVPENLVQSAARGELLGLIVVSLFVGFILSRLPGEPGRVLRAFTEGVYSVSLGFTALVLRVAPIGVLGLLACTMSEQYASLAPEQRFADFLTGILSFAAVALAGLGLHMFVTMSLFLLASRANPWRHLRAMTPALMTAFSTASSAATLPVTMDCVQQGAGVSKKTASFVLPLGATVNMDGTALYECVAAMFICQAFGVDLSFQQQLLIAVTALLTSIGVAGVPAASLVAIVVILQAVEAGLPEGALSDGVSLVAGLGLLFVFDRPLDMCRTAVNIFSDSCGAVAIARSEGELSDQGPEQEGTT